jgi:outer membrane protein assembly factor BamB
MIRLLCSSLFAVVFGLSSASAADWPQWMGPTRDGVWAETGVVDKFPAGGLKKLWSAPLGGGYSGPAVANGKVYVMDYLRASGDTKNEPANRNTLTGKERVLCLDAKSGKELWAYPYDRPYHVSYPAGPRCTPTVDGDRVYALGAMGDLLCLKADKAEVVWKKDLAKEYGAEVPQWGFCGHPLVYGDLLICLVGGNGSVAVAFDKKTGKEAWKALSSKDQGYCPPTVIKAGGVDQLLIYHSEGLHGLNPLTGAEYWKVPMKPSYGMSINAPVRYNEYLFAGGIGNEAVMLKLAADKPAVTEVWRGVTKSKGLAPANATPLMPDGTLYGADCMSGEFRAVELESGKVLWRTHGPTNGKDTAAPHGTAFAVKNGDRYFLFSETGELVLARLTAEKYDEIGRAKLLDPTGEGMGRKVVWTHPAFADKKVFARNDKEIVCYDLAK